MTGKRPKSRTGVLLIVLMAFTLSACDAAMRAATGAKRAPDEFAVYKRPPLSLPPEFGLRPPEPGRQQLETISPRDQARSAVLGPTAGHTGAQPTAPVQAQSLGNQTPGLLALLERTGATGAEPGIRSIVDRETLNLSEEDRRLIDKLIFWVDDPEYPGTVVDPAEEQRRLLETQALGQPINEGKTPEIKRKTRRKGILPF